MKGDTIESRRISTYWYVWLGIVAFAFILRFTIFLGVTSDRRSSLPITYMLGTWLPIMLLNLIEGRRLMLYLKTHHRQKWEQLTRIPGFGHGWHNGFRLLPWLYSAEDSGDPALATLKAEHRRFIRFVLTVFFSYIIILPLLSI